MKLIFNNILIRGKTQLKSMNPVLIDALKLLARKYRNEEIPIVYQYSHDANAEFFVDVDNKIGTLTNFRFIKGNFVGDADILDIMKLSIHFTGVIDNLVVAMNDKGDYIVKGFIIYDKTFKEEVNRTRVNNINKSLPKPGEIPLGHRINNTIAMKNIQDTLMKEFLSDTNNESKGDE